MEKMLWSIRLNRKGFSLVELLIVLSIFAILMSLLMPALKKSTFISKNMQCVFNLKTQGLAYSLYCQDNDDLFPGIRESDKKSRITLGNFDKPQYGSIDNNDYDIRFQIAPYFENGNAIKANGKYSLYIKAFQCPLGREQQTEASYPEAKRYYDLYFNVAQPFESTNVADGYHYNDSETANKVMHQSGDTWVWDRVETSGGWSQGIQGMRFNVVASDIIEVDSTIKSNHFWDAPDLQLGTNWGPYNPHHSQIGELVLNVASDDGSTHTFRATRDVMEQAGLDGWNSRGGNGDGGGNDFALPRSLAVGN